MAVNKRADPFTEEEKLVLQECMFSFKNVIENKRTDGTSLDKKHKAWASVTVAFNSYMNVKQRSEQQLRKAWDNIKSRHKKESALLSRHRMATGGGPSMPDNSETPLLELIVPGINHTITGGYDSDVILPLNSFNSPTAGLSQPLPNTQPTPSRSELSSAASISGLMDRGLLSDDVSDEENASVTTAARSAQTRPAALSGQNGRFGRMSVIREEHILRTQQLQASSTHNNELQEIRVREARALAEAAEARRDAALEDLEAARHNRQIARLRFLNETEELDVQRHRRHNLLDMDRDLGGGDVTGPSTSNSSL